MNVPRCAKPGPRPRKDSHSSSSSNQGFDISARRGLETGLRGPQTGDLRRLVCSFLTRCATSRAARARNGETELATCVAFKVSP
eukprot:1371623-Amorphochlora_amoeboformis.AAC.1